MARDNEDEFYDRHEETVFGSLQGQVALEAIRGDLTLAQLAAKHGVHQTLINSWKKQAIEGMSGTFSGKAEAAEADRRDEIDKLHALIGQLVVEGDFLKRASGR